MNDNTMAVLIVFIMFCFFGFIFWLRMKYGSTEEPSCQLPMGLRPIGLSSDANWFQPLS